jgi:hypothetical protein
MKSYSHLSLAVVFVKALYFLVLRSKALHGVICGMSLVLVVEMALVH